MNLTFETHGQLKELLILAPPLGANGWDDGASGGGLWQWTPFAGKITLGDFDGQVAFMISYKQQWDITGSWFRAAGLPDPTPKNREFLTNFYITSLVMIL